MSMAQFWTLAQSKYISKGVQKWTLLGSKVVPPGGSVFGLFILSDFLKLCRLPCAQNVKLEATLTQTASAAGILNCSRPWLPPRGCYVMCDVDICNLIRTTRFKRVFEWASNRPQGGTGFRMSRHQFWTLAQSKCLSKGVQKWTLLGSKVVPPGGSVFGLFILSDLLKLCRLPCAQNVKLEATLTQTASAAGILNCSRPWLPPRGCYVMCDVDICNLIRTTRFKRVFEWASNRPQGGTGFRMSRHQFWTLAQSKCLSKGVQKWTLLGSKVVPPGGSVFGLFFCQIC